MTIQNLFYIILGIPGLSFDVMLMFYQNSEQAKTNDNLADVSSKPPGSLDIYSDPEMEQFFTKGIRGGQSFISQSYARGNSNPRKSGDHLLYIDGNFILYYLINLFVQLAPYTDTVSYKHLSPYNRRLLKHHNPRD